MANDLPSEPELEPRQPTLEDLRDLCRELNARGALCRGGRLRHRAAGYIRETMDIDLIVARDRENEAKVFSALSTLPDNATRCANCSQVSLYLVARSYRGALRLLQGSSLVTHGDGERGVT